MTTRRDIDRRADRDRDDYPPSKRPAGREAAPRPKLDEFWLDGEGIDRQVLQSSICRFLGPEATSRPFEYNGKAGYKIKAVRPFTPDMLDDLKSLSQAFIQENRALRGRNRDEVRYEESETRIHRDIPAYDHDPRERNTYSSGSGYSGMSNTYTSEASMPSGYASMYHTSGSYQGNPSYTTMAPSGGMPAYSDGRYPPDYPYQPGRDMPPPGYGGYQGGGGYADPGRFSRPEMQTGHFPTAGASIPRGAMMADDPRDPRYAGGYDTMQGIQHGGGAYAVPSRGQNPSPYDAMPRDQYARPSHPADSYVSRRR